MNYFELFDLPMAPTVDRKLIAKKYFELQRKSHPDFFTNATEEEKEIVLQQSADINKAFKIFQQEENTIEYFLALKGTIAKDEKYNLPPDFLMEMMELNEALDETDAETTIEKVKEYQTGLYQQVVPILLNYNEAKTTTAELEKLKAYYYKKKYLQRILDRMGD